MRRRLLGLGLAIAIVLALIPAGPSQAVVRRSISISAPQSAITGATVTISGKLKKSPKGSKVVVRRKSGSRWVTVASTRTTNAAGTYKRTIKVPRTAGTYAYQAYAPRMAKRSAAVSKARRIVVRKPAPKPTPTPTGPAVVTGLKASSTSTQVVLNWTNPAGTTAVSVRRAEGATAPTSPTAGTAVPVTGAPTTVTDTVTPNLLYSYSVFATTPKGVTAPASAARPGPAAPTNGAATTAPGKMTFTWTNPAGVHRVLVYFSPTGGVPIGAPGAPPSGDDIGTAETYTAHHVPSVQQVSLTIYALDEDDNYLGSLSIIETSGAGTDIAPDPVTDPTATTTPRSVALAWTQPASNEFLSVIVARSDGTSPPATPTSGRLVGRVGNGQATITDPDAEPGHTYTYGLWTVEGTDNYSTRSSITVTTPSGAAQGPVAALAATALPARPDATGQTVRLGWTNPAGATSILVSRAEGPTAPGAPSDAGGVSLPLPVTSYRDNNLRADTAYSYSVWAVGADGNISAVRTATVSTEPNFSQVSGVVRNSVTHDVLGSVPLSFRVEGEVNTTDITSDADGSYDLDLSVGTYSVCPAAHSVTGGGAAHGYVSTCSTLTVDSAAATSYDVPVVPAAAITGVVTDASTDEPIAGVTMWMTSDFSGFPPTIVTTDDDGRYLLTGITAGPDTVRRVYVDPAEATNGAAHGYVEVQFDEAVETDGEVVQHDIELEPAPVITISGRLTSAADGTGIEGVEVDVRGPGGREPLAQTDSDADGNYSVTTGLAPGRELQVCFNAEHPGDPTAATGYTNACYGGVDVDARTMRPYEDPTTVSGTQTVDLALRPAVAIRGTVTDASDEPLAGATATTDTWGRECCDKTTTDAAGHFILYSPQRKYTPGEPAVRVCAEGPTATGGSSTGGYLFRCVTLQAPAAAVETPTLALDAATTVTGQVVDSSTGLALSGASVSVHPKVHVPGSSGSDTTDADGRYTVRGLAPPADAAYQVCVSAAGYAHDEETSCVPISTLGVASLTQGTTARPTHFQATPHRHGSISGVVTGQDTGLPVPDVTVNLNQHQTTTDEDGRYRFTDLEASDDYDIGTEKVRAGPQGYRAEPFVKVSVAPGAETRADLVLDPAAAVRVQVVTQDGRPAAGVTIDGQRLTGSFEWIKADDHGVVTIRGLAPTPYPEEMKVCAMYGGVGPGTIAGYTYGCGTLPTLSNGTTADTTVVVGLDSDFSAVVYDATTGQPIKDASVSFFWKVDELSHIVTNTAQTNVNGAAIRTTAIDMSPTGPTNPALPDPATARVCVKAQGYQDACFGDAAADGSSGPELISVPGFWTQATFLLTPTS